MTEVEIGQRKIAQKCSYNYDKTYSTISQIIAVLVGNMIMLQFGMSIAMPTIINGQLMSKEEQSKGEFTLTNSEASWYGSLLLVSHPIGSLLSAFIQDKYGRKTCFMIVCFPQFLGWFALYIARSSGMLYISSCSLGLAMGLSEAPILTYVGESTEPRLRSALCSLSNFSSMIGLFMSYLIASLLTWRQLASIYMCLPTVVFLMTILVIPESPIWLLSKNRTKKATRSLCWLRGFTTSDLVREELSYMLQYVRDKNYDNEVPMHGEKKGKLRFLDKVKENWKMLTDKSVLRPFILLDFIFLFCTISSMIPVKPYLVKVITKVGIPIEPKLALVIIGINTISGAFLNMLTIKLIGKRLLLLICISISVLLQLAIGIYAMGIGKSFINTDWFPFTLFCVISFISGFGITPIPWILLGELFPMKGRGQISGITAAVNFGVGFFLTKTYLDVVSTCTLPWTLIIYSVIGAMGIPYIYYKLPETESKTLQQIQECFED